MSKENTGGWIRRGVQEGKNGYDPTSHLPHAELLIVLAQKSVTEPACLLGPRLRWGMLFESALGHV